MALLRHVAGRLDEEDLTFLPKEVRATIFWEARLMLAIYFGIAVYCIVTGWTGPLYYWLLPFLMGEPVMRAIRMTEHVGRPTVPDMQVNTRWMGMTERAVTLFFYNQVVFAVFSAVVGLLIGNGRFANPDVPVLDFLFRAWVTPTAWDLAILILLGALSASGGYMMTLAYRGSPSHIIAPFEHLALLMAVIWGAVFWQVLPDWTASCGILLIVAAGLSVAFREARLGIRTRKRHRET